MIYYAQYSSDLVCQHDTKREWVGIISFRYYIDEKLNYSTVLPCYFVSFSYIGNVITLNSTLNMAPYLCVTNLQTHVCYMCKCDPNIFSKGSY